LTRRRRPAARRQEGKPLSQVACLIVASKTDRSTLPVVADWLEEKLGLTATAFLLRQPGLPEVSPPRAGGAVVTTSRPSASPGRGAGSEGVTGRGRVPSSSPAPARRRTGPRVGPRRRPAAGGPRYARLDDAPGEAGRVAGALGAGRAGRRRTPPRPPVCAPEHAGGTVIPPGRYPSRGSASKPFCRNSLMASSAASSVENVFSRHLGAGPYTMVENRMPSSR
jgi:hypothetical protein